MAALAALGVPALFSTACMGYPMEGAVATPPPPGTTGESRLPSLLTQLQGAGAGMEVFDGSQNDVLGAQDGDDSGVTVTPSVFVPTATPTPPGDKGDTGSNPTPIQTVAGANTPAPRPTQGTNEGNPTVTPTPTPTPTQGPSEASPTPSPTPTNTPAPTATPTPVQPPSEGPGTGGLPPSEGG